ncbi:hypothetical protein [Yinghuangia seranimata]|uniref:hypothetical protein n=1 Tax=Yinghuangia seranimata TaxID=408067 RepID=UPI00248C1CCE|nr:hypothetical protein [Yinghuangia seranimata]MDI2125346.1 hypothetical protein [Yinghuangia seranimata]
MDMACGCDGELFWVALFTSPAGWLLAIILAVVVLAVLFAMVGAFGAGVGFLGVAGAEVCRRRWGPPVEPETELDADAPLMSVFTWYDEADWFGYADDPRDDVLDP